MADLTAKDEIALAENYRFSAEKDPHRGGPWCRFKKDDVVVWQPSYRKWIRARLVFDYLDGDESDGRYTEHAMFRTLEEALAATPESLAQDTIREAASLLDRGLFRRYDQITPEIYDAYRVLGLDPKVTTPHDAVEMFRLQ